MVRRAQVCERVLLPGLLPTGAERRRPGLFVQLATVQCITVHSNDYEIVVQHVHFLVPMEIPGKRSVSVFWKIFESYRKINVRQLSKDN